MTVWLLLYYPQVGDETVEAVYASESAAQAAKRQKVQPGHYGVVAFEVLETAE